MFIHTELKYHVTGSSESFAYGLVEVAEILVVGFGHNQAVALGYALV